MDEILAITFDALDRYFTVLGKTGYMKDDDVFKLLYLVFISEFLQEFSEYITDDDFNNIACKINCMSECSCLIDSIQTPYSATAVNVYNKDNMEIRISEEEIDRFDEENLQRLVVS